jgi:hypothetical protein
MLAHAIDMRRGAGLRHDLAYVIAAQTDPRARINLLDFPLYPEEEEVLLANMNEQDAIAAIVESYARHFEAEYGGLYIDREDRPGYVTALWIDHLAEHEAAIRALIGDRSLFAVREVKYPHAELRSFQDMIAKDMQSGWVDDIPADLQAVGVDVKKNILFVEVSSANPDAVSIIEAQYDLGDRLRVTSDGTGAALLSWGTVQGLVLGPGGERLEGEQNGAEPLPLMLAEIGDSPGECGGGDIGYGVDGRGRFEFPCQVGMRTIVIRNEHAYEEILARVTVPVRADETVKVRIQLTRLP